MDVSKNASIRRTLPASSSACGTNNTSTASLRTVGTDTSVACVKFTGLMNDDGSESDSSDEGRANESREPQQKIGSGSDIVASRSPAATVRFTGLFDDGQDSDASQKSDDDGNPFTSHGDDHFSDNDTNPFRTRRKTSLSDDDNNPFTSRVRTPDDMNPFSAPHTSQDRNKPPSSKATITQTGVNRNLFTSGLKTSMSVEPIALPREASAYSNTRRISLTSEADLVFDLDVAENHYALPDDDQGPSTIAELQAAIEYCKQQVKLSVPHTDKAKDLTRKLVQLRLKLLDATDGSTVVDTNVKRVMAHQFEERPWGSAKGYCERCNGMIIGIVQTWFKCTVCGFCCHKRCLNLITRTCAGQKVSENPTYILNICPERGLHAQNYRCAECRANIGFQTARREARLCDYNGLFYCNHCHWNDTMVIMSRVLSNWDFQPRKICRSSKQILKLMIRKAVVRVQDINPMLFSYMDELNQVKKLREEILIMKKYFLLCTAALRSRLLVKLQGRQHFVDNSDMYSVQDLIDLANDVLLPEITKIHASFAQHIKVECEACRAKGYVCLICHDADILFPFDNCAFVCPKCSYVVHRHCYIAKNQKCPKCERSQAAVSTES